MKIESASDLFNHVLPTELAARTSAFAAIGGAYTFVIVGNDGGRWRLDLDAKPSPILVAFNPSFPAATSRLLSGGCQVTISDTDLEALIVAPHLAMQLYFQGKLKVEGDVMLASKNLPKIFALIGT